MLDKDLYEKAMCQKLNLLIKYCKEQVYPHLIRDLVIDFNNMVTIKIYWNENYEGPKMIISDSLKYIFEYEYSLNNNNRTILDTGEIKLIEVIAANWEEIKKVFRREIAKQERIMNCAFD